MYNGIEINEIRLLVESIIFSVLLLILILIGCFFIAFSYDKQNKKSKIRIKKLKRESQADTIASKKLVQEEKKFKRRKQKAREDIFIIALIAVFIALLIVVCSIFWCDYIIKDYVIYEGEFEVYRSTRRSYITLEDGTKIHGAACLSHGEHIGTLVYSKRSHIALGYK